MISILYTISKGANVVNDKEMVFEEISMKAVNGMVVFIGLLTLYLGSYALIVMSILMMRGGGILPSIILVLSIIYACLGWIPFMGLKVLKPKEALVLTLFGKYKGTLKGEGFFFVNPFVSAVIPSSDFESLASTEDATHKTTQYTQQAAMASLVQKKTISLKALTLNNNKQKVNDILGNPLEIGIVVIWRVVNTAKAVFNVDNYKSYLSIQCDSSLRNVARLYPYDVAEEGEEKTLRGSSLEVAKKLKEEIQSKVDIAGIEIIEARITHLAYAPEIASAMLQRQQASAIIDARKMIVEGAVSMVEMALNKLSENEIVVLDDERKAVMVSNLLVVLCGNKDAQPIVNSGSLY
jgi:regulator of protease activity HflC (stomatin/prohibitin superfamily)